jgi:hypothetical protein
MSTPRSSSARPGTWRPSSNATAGAAALPLGRLAGRTVPAEASLAGVHRAMTGTGQRRIAVTSTDGRLLGLLCLKATRAGFCSGADVRARARDQAGGGR